MKRKNDLGLQSFNKSLHSVEAVACPSDGIDVVGDEVVDGVEQVIAIVHCSSHSQLEQLEFLELSLI